jgi:hypothetical protein
MLHKKLKYGYFVHYDKRILPLGLGMYSGQDFNSPGE